MIKTIAHRGYSARYPENSMLAFTKALETGCEGIELDVHLSSDGIPVILHDEWVDRTTDGAGAVKDMTLAQLRALHLDQGERIPTLEEYLDLVRTSSVFTDIELKNSIFPYPGLEREVIRLIRRYGLEDRTLFSSFNHFSILECKKEAPEIFCGLLTWSWLIGAGGYTRKNGVECYHPEFHSVTSAAMEERIGADIGASRPPERKTAFSAAILRVRSWRPLRTPSKKSLEGMELVIDFRGDLL